MGGAAISSRVEASKGKRGDRDNWVPYDQGNSMLTLSFLNRCLSSTQMAIFTQLRRDLPSRDQNTHQSASDRVVNRLTKANLVSDRPLFCSHGKAIDTRG